jgi:apolipoprotein D and lipocalin family protein
MNKLKYFVNNYFFTLLILLMVCPTTIYSQPLQTTAYVDLKKYAGKWYEIASFPQRFQKGCHCTTAEYTLSEKGYVIVKNSCRKNSMTGKLKSIRGKAFVVKGSGNAKLKVQFFWPIRGKYWIIDLAEDYSYAVVSHPNRKYLWILSRTPVMDDVVYGQILSRLKEKGLDIEKLKKTPQI